MTKVFLLFTTLLTTVSFAKSVDLLRLEIQNDFIETSYGPYLSGKGYNALCTDVLFWLGFSYGTYPPTKEKNRDVYALEHTLKSSCIDALSDTDKKDPLIDDYKLDEIEKGVENQLISLELYLYYVQSLYNAGRINDPSCYSNIKSKDENSEEFADEIKKCQKINDKKYEEQRSNIEPAIKAVGVSPKYVSKLKKTFEAFRKRSTK